MILKILKYLQTYAKVVLLLSLKVLVYNIFGCLVARLHVC